MIFGRSILFLFFSMLVLVGCARQGPDPLDTAPPIGAPDRPDWVVGGDDADFGANVDDFSGLGLYARDGIDGDEERGLLPSIFFDFDSSVIRPGDRSQLNEVFQFFRQNPDLRLIIEGHCDYKGTEEYNMALGDRRARSAKDFLLNLGMSADRISIRSMGDTQAVFGGTDQQRAQDRRGDFIVARPNLITN